MRALRYGAGPLLAMLLALPAAADEPPAPGAPAPPAPGVPAPPTPNVPPPAKPPPPAAPAAPAPATEPMPTPYRGLFPFGVRDARAGDDAMAGPSARHEALRAGLAWLAAHQTPSGSWDPSALGWCNGKEGTTTPGGPGKRMYEPGVTGLAVYTFLVAGHVPEAADPYGKHVAAGLAWLRGQVDKEGCVGPREYQHYIYNHAFGSLALVEGFAATGDMGLLASAQATLAFSERARNPGMAWRYGVRPGDNDTSATGCVGMPFCLAQRVNEAAASAGLVEPLAIDDQLDEGVRAWLDRMTDPEYGRLGYLHVGQGPARPAEHVEAFPNEVSEAPTAIGIALRLLLPGGDPQRDADAIAKGTVLVRRLAPKWNDPKGSTDLYYWYYGSLAMHAVGGDAWKEWDQALLRVLPAQQRMDGDVCGARGSWDPVDPWGDDGGRIYTTCLVMLSLMTPWRAPRLPAQRGDLAAALHTKDAPPAAMARWLEAAGLHRATGAERTAATLLKSPDPTLRAGAVRVVARTDPGPGAAQAVVALLADPDPAVRRAAAEAARGLEARAGPAVRALVQALADADVEVRALAADALGSVGAAAASAAGDLRARLTDGDPRVRVAVAGALVRLAPNPGEQGPVLSAGLAAPPPRVRADALRHLGRLGDGSHAAAMAPLLADPAGIVRLAAAEALVALGKRDEPVVKALAAALIDPDLDGRRAALRVLTTLGPAAAPASHTLGGMSLGGPPALRIAALQALGAVGPGAAEALPALHYNRASGRGPLLQAAETALTQVTVPPAEAVAVLTRALDTSDQRVVIGAIAGLVVQGAAALQPLMAVVRDPKRPVPARVRSLQALVHLGVVAEPAVWPLERVLDEDPDANVRREAANVLGAIGPRAGAAAPTLVRHLEDKDLGVQAASARALAKVATPAAVEALLAVAKRKTKEPDYLRLEAIRSLGELGAAAAPHYDALLLLRVDDQKSVADAAGEALGRLGGLFVERLRQHLKDSAKIRRAAVLAVADIGPEAKAAVPELGDIFESVPIGLTSLAANALARIGKPAVKTLTKGLKHETASVRAAAAWALATIGKDAASAVPALKTLARTDKDAEVQKAAEGALEAIKSAK